MVLLEARRNKRFDEQCDRSSSEDKDNGIEDDEDNGIEDDEVDIMNGLEKGEMLVLYVTQGTCLPLDATRCCFSCWGVINWWSKIIVNFNHFVKIQT